MTGQCRGQDKIESAYLAACDVFEHVRNIRNAGSFEDKVKPETKWAPSADALRRIIPAAEEAIRDVLGVIEAATRGQGICRCGHLSAPTAHELVLRLGEHALSLLDSAPAASVRREYERILSQCERDQPAAVRQELEQLRSRPLCTSNLDVISKIRPDLYELIAELQHEGPLTTADSETVVKIMRSIGAPSLGEWNALEAQLQREKTDVLTSQSNGDAPSPAKDDRDRDSEASPPGHPRNARIVVDIENTVVTVDGKPFGLVGAERTKRRLAAFVQELINANGEFRARPSDIKTRDIECQRDEVRDLFDSQPGAGTRIPQDRIWRS